MSSLPIVLFLLGAVFLLLGWRWQSPTNEEARTALKGLAYLKREILRVQDQVHILEDKIEKKGKMELKESALQEAKRRVVDHKSMEHAEIERNEKSKLYSLKTRDEKQSISGIGVEPKRNISPKYLEVLDLASKGHSIPDIAQHLLLSQDEVMMVLGTQSKGVAR